jgi:hypothetical protein
VFILFDAQCRKCHKLFKAEVECGSEPSFERCHYRCECPQCHVPVIVRGEHGTLADTATWWAVLATLIGGASSTTLSRYAEVFTR